LFSFLSFAVRFRSDLFNAPQKAASGAERDKPVVASRGAVWSSVSTAKRPASEPNGQRASKAERHILVRARGQDQVCHRLGVDSGGEASLMRARRAISPHVMDIKARILLQSQHPNKGTHKKTNEMNQHVLRAEKQTSACMQEHERSREAEAASKNFQGDPQA
jgi:hypothetical protein